MVERGGVGDMNMRRFQLAFATIVVPGILLFSIWFFHARPIPPSAIPSWFLSDIKIASNVKFPLVVDVYGFMMAPTTSTVPGLVASDTHIARYWCH